MQFEKTMENKINTETQTKCTNDQDCFEWETSLKRLTVLKLWGFANWIRMNLIFFRIRLVNSINWNRKQNTSNKNAIAARSIQFHLKYTKVLQNAHKFQRFMIFTKYVPILNGCSYRCRCCRCSSTKYSLSKESVKKEEKRRLNYIAFTLMNVMIMCQSNNNFVEQRIQRWKKKWTVQHV